MDVGRSASQACLLSCSWLSMIGAFEQSFFLPHTGSPLSGLGDLSSSREVGDDDACRELHYFAEDLYKMEIPFSNSALN